MICVDEIQHWPSGPTCFKYGFCHLTCLPVNADELDSLHDFANRLGIKRSWFQDHSTHPHYDITARKRIQAIDQGAVFLTAREQARRRRRSGL